MKNNSRKPYIIAVVLSLLLHAVILWILFIPQVLAFLKPPLPVDAEPPPLVLEFDQPAAQQAPEPAPEETPAEAESKEEEKQQPLPEKYFLVEENPNANNQKPKDASILAANASVSAAPQKTDLRETALLPPVEDPDPTIKDIKAENEETPTEEDAGLNLEETAGRFAYLQNREFTKRLLSEKAPTETEDPLKKTSQTQKSPPLLEEFKGDLVGDVALSTYEWKWAPWVLALKEAFYRHLYVPRAYSMGLIEGYTEVWIKVDRSGKLVAHKLLQSEGHPTLKESTINAFLSSTPWKALPSDFPDEYLELRVRVIYPNLKELFLKRRASN